MTDDLLMVANTMARDATERRLHSELRAAQQEAAHYRNALVRIRGNGCRLATPCEHCAACFSAETLRGWTP